MLLYPGLILTNTSGYASPIGDTAATMRKAAVVVTVVASNALVELPVVVEPVEVD